MNRRHFPYPTYERSAAEWQEDVPSGWSSLALGRMFRRVTRSGFPDEELLSVYRDYGVIPKTSRNDNFNKASEDLSPYQLVRPGDLVMNKMKAWQGSIAMSKHRGIVSPAYFVYEPWRDGDDRIELNYIHYLLRSSAYITQYLSRSKGIRVNQWDLDPSAFERIEVLLPSLDEQTQIATFLDDETAKIDALIAKLQQLIALLQEKRQAVISHAVTKGLNPDAPLRESGVEWLGDVPEHWEVGQLRRWIRKMEQGKSPECERRPAEGTEWGVLKTSCVNKGLYAEQENKALPSHLLPVKRYEVHDGDVLMSRASGSTELIGSVAFVHVTRPRNLLSDKIFRLHFEAKIAGRYFTYLMASSYMRSLIVRAVSGAEGMANNITKTAVLGFPVAVPPIREQIQIATFLNDETVKIDALIAESQTGTALLQERRAALISAAVTGKIDVRDWKPTESDTEAA